MKGQSLHSKVDHLSYERAVSEHRWVVPARFNLEIMQFVRARLSAYAYPRRIEFVADLPKTLTRKIRRVELRQRA